MQQSTRATRKPSDAQLAARARRLQAQIVALTAQMPEYSDKYFQIRMDMSKASDAMNVAAGRLENHAKGEQ